MDINTTSKYLAIKVRGLDPWLWFERVKTTRENGVFIGTGGWGLDGNHTEIKVDQDLIEAEMSSEALQW